MQFKHPEVLYALSLLLIPILIHLFQLRRFQKIDFTNVAFLKKVTIQTRKSSQLKKWITLLLRLLALAAIVIAFAQPFTASKSALNTNKETVLYIDNSFSMQAKGANGPLLQRVLQQLYEQTSGNERISWFTNTETHKDASLQDFKAEILSVRYVQNQLSPKEVLLKADQLFSSEEGAQKRLLYISDLQVKDALPAISDKVMIEVVQARSVAANNIAIDTAYIASRNALTTKLNVSISSQGEVPASVPISLFKGETLIAKIAADLSTSGINTVSFDIDEPRDFRGRLEINDANLTYDNSLYFSINTPKKIKILSINDVSSEFLGRLYNQPEFEYKQQSASSLNYNDIPDQNFVILNELKTIPASLTSALNAFVENGGSLMVIPAENIDPSGYNDLLAQLRLGSFTSEEKQEKKISKIVFAHPLFESVFEKQVVNFQYPKVNAYYPISTNATAALRFEDSKPFIVQQNNVYVATAALNTANSNFQNSPLIVPTFYNMAMQSLPLTKLYYENDRQNTFAVPIQLSPDEILTIKDSVTSLIPLQQTKANKVLITTTEAPINSGNYTIEKDEEMIELVSYNYARTESQLQYFDVKDWEGVRNYDSIEAMFDTISEENTINSFWKWFVIFAILFLIFEMLVLKFYKK